MVGRHPLLGQGLPEESIGVGGLCELHAVDLDELEGREVLIDE